MHGTFSSDAQVDAVLTVLRQKHGHGFITITGGALSGQQAYVQLSQLHAAGVPEDALDWQIRCTCARDRKGRLSVGNIISATPPAPLPSVWHPARMTRYLQRGFSFCSLEDGSPDIFLDPGRTTRARRLGLRVGDPLFIRFTQTPPQGRNCRAVTHLTRDRSECLEGSTEAQST